MQQCARQERPARLTIIPYSETLPASHTPLSDKKQIMDVHKRLDPTSKATRPNRGLLNTTTAAADPHQPSTLA